MIDFFIFSLIVKVEVILLVAMLKNCIYFRTGASSTHDQAGFVSSAVACTDKVNVADQQQCTLLTHTQWPVTVSG